MEQNFLTGLMQGFGQSLTAAKQMQRENQMRDLQMEMLKTEKKQRELQTEAQRQKMGSLAEALSMLNGSPAQFQLPANQPGPQIPERPGMPIEQVMSNPAFIAKGLESGLLDMGSIQAAQQQAQAKQFIEGIQGGGGGHQMPGMGSLFDPGSIQVAGITGNLNALKPPQMESMGRTVPIMLNGVPTQVDTMTGKPIGPMVPKEVITEVLSPDGGKQKVVVTTGGGTNPIGQSELPAGQEKGAEEKAKLTAEAQAKQIADSKANATAFNVFNAAIKNVENTLAATTTGPVLGRLPAITSNQQTAEKAIAIMAPTLKALFRSVGEGTFTDRDQEILLQMIPSRTDNKEAIKNSLEMISEVVRIKLSLPSQESIKKVQGDQESTGGKFLGFE